MLSSSACRQGLPDVLDEMREHPGSHLLVRRVTVWQVCHNTCGINDALHTHEFIVESREPTMDHVWRQLQMKEQAAILILACIGFVVVNCP